MLILLILCWNWLLARQAHVLTLLEENNKERKTKTLAEQVLQNAASLVIHIIVEQ